jgi:acid phosphatase class B
MGASEEKYTNKFFQELFMFTKLLQQGLALENNNSTNNFLTVVETVTSRQTTVEIFSVEAIEWKGSCNKPKNLKLECNNMVLFSSMF